MDKIKFIKKIILEKGRKTTTTLQMKYFKLAVISRLETRKGERNLGPQLNRLRAVNVKWNQEPTHKASI